MKQMIISIGREFGSGGHAIAEILANKYNIPLYDHNLLDEVAKEKGMDIDELRRYDELPKHLFFSRNVNGYSNAPEEIVAHMQFDFLKEKSEAGESFVVVGRCAETVLKENSNLVSIFITGEQDQKVKRVCEVYGIDEKEAHGKMLRHDKNRKAYHNYFCEGNWGDSRNYDMCISSSLLGVEKTAEIIEAFINEAFNN